MGIMNENMAAAEEDVYSHPLFDETDPRRSSACSAKRPENSMSVRTNSIGRKQCCRLFKHTSVGTKLRSDQALAIASVTGSLAFA